ncbi:MAG: FUSC family protein [Massilia sp.]
MSRTTEAATLPALSGALRRFPAFGLNGASAAMGVAVVGLIVAALGGPVHAQLAIVGAVCVSLSDAPVTTGRVSQRVFLAAVLSALAALTVEATKSHEGLVLLGIFCTGLVSMMTMGWGAWAGTVSFGTLLSMVLTMAAPATVGTPWQIAAWSAIGGFSYWIWAVATAPLLQGRYRAQALSDAVAAMAEQLSVRAALLNTQESQGGLPAAMHLWLRGEATLAERFQAARVFVLAEREGVEANRHSAILIATIEVRDLLLASRLDLDIVSTDPLGRELLGRLAACLRDIAHRLDCFAAELLDGLPRGEPADMVFSGRFDGIRFAPGDMRERLVPALYDRLANIASEVNRMGHLLRCAPTDPILARLDLSRFVVPEDMPVMALKEQLGWQSPVFRHALRLSVAMCCGYLLAQALPWVSHPYWVVLTVVVVLRGTMDQTLSRRNSRVFGTLIGCVVVAALARISSTSVLEVCFIVAVGVAHAFLARQYWITAVAATVMALLQAHFVVPSGGFAVFERAADTVVGALLAWAFSFVLPSWERRQLPASVFSAMRDLGAYASEVLRSTSQDLVALRVARRKAYGSLNAIANAMQRTSAEPDSVRLPTQDVARFLDFGQRLLAHLSLIRAMLAGHGSRFDEAIASARLREAHDAVKESLSQQGPGKPAWAQAECFDFQLPLPENGPLEDPLPWLERRLAILINDAARTRSAADALLDVNEGSAACSRTGL